MNFANTNGRFARLDPKWIIGIVCLCSCSSLTDVESTDVIEPEDLGNPAGAEAMRAGAIGSFTTAFGGGRAGPGGAFFGSSSQVVLSGLISDEFHTGHAVSVWAAPDFRTLPEPSEGPYMFVQRARIDAKTAIAALKAYAPTPPARIGHLYALVGFTEVFLGENVCSGVPLGDIVDWQPVYGVPLSTAQMFERAVSSFDTALSHAAGDAQIENLARVGRGRALLNLGRFNEAATAVAGVPDSYVFELQYNAEVDPNAYYQSGVVSRAAVVSDNEGGNGLDFRSANDPRVPTAAAGMSSDGGVSHYVFTRYATAATPITLTSGIEARLIQAEAAYHADPENTTPSGWLGILNALRASQISPALAPLSDPGTDAARVDLIFRERAFWMFATGHRHGDLRRLVRQYGRAIEAVFPTGFARPTIVYGSDITFTPDASQQNSPNYSQCANRDA